CFNQLFIEVPFLPTLASPLAKPSNSSSHYIWEFMGDEGIWTEYQKPVSSKIESLYQLNPQCQVSFTAIYSLCHNFMFTGMYQVNNKYGTKRAVRRNASGLQPTNRNLDFVFVQDIEAQYQQDSTGIMSLRVGRFSNELDFSGV
uniref:WWE domain-containing protein n=1 Tax=Sinocyclocheilus rhinocerous TaxID=307959 RepID=A0A673NC22_9TELE